MSINVLPEARPSADDALLHDHSANSASAPRSRAQANRENAKHSTGPKTEDGKRAVRFNSVSHGATSKCALLPQESAADYETLLQKLHNTYRPETAFELDLVSTIRDLKWRLARLDRYENSVFLTAYVQAQDEIDANYAPETEDDRRILAEGLSYQKSKGTLNQIHRHSRAFRRDIEKAEDDLIRAIKARLDLRSGAATRQLEMRKLEHEVDLLVSDAPPEKFFRNAEPSEPDVENGFALSNSEQPAKTGVKMPKFSGPNRKQARKNWLRAQRNAGKL
jgi:hypothetical protein